jgi:hypothetical protein
MSWRHTTTLRAAAGQGRRVHVIMEFVEEIALGNLDDPHAKRDGMKMYRTHEGGEVNRISDTEFEIVSTGERVRVVLGV